ncbi:hypothetical protein [Citrobacter freundii]|uniref:hypothetical protein n=1 Tax=Citrobacter freundii TaxID=546 RepID=UPI001F2A2193|nr:hypothetical protein [Citrobacter freundii]
MKPDVKKIIADIKATKGNRKFCNGLAGTLQDDNYASSICKYVKTVTPERIDLLIEYAEKLEAEVTDMTVQLANAESKCRVLAAEVQAVRWACGQVYMKGYNHGHLNTVDGIEYASDTELVERGGETLADFTDPDHCGVAADAILAEARAQGVEMLAAEYESKIEPYKNHDEFMNAHYLKMQAIEARNFADKLRKGSAL